MKVYLVDRSYFTFRGVKSGELGLCGKSTVERMQENLGAEMVGIPPEGEKMVLYPAFPFLQREKLEAFISSHTGSVCFAGGYLERGGAFKNAESFAGGIFSLGDFALAREKAAREIREYHLSRGVLVEEGAQIDCRAQIAAGAVIGRGSKIVGACTVGAGAEIIASELTESSVGVNTVVKNSVFDRASVGADCTVGPNAYLRPNSLVGDHCRIGDFVEIKNACVGSGCKISHLAYVGDADLGEKVNVGCGVVFVNYNGRKKFRTRVGNGCFIGSNCNLVAPVNLGERVFLAAGTTLTQDLQSGDFCIGRSRETVKPLAAKKYLDE